MVGYLNMTSARVMPCYARVEEEKIGLNPRQRTSKKMLRTGTKVFPKEEHTKWSHLQNVYIQVMYLFLGIQTHGHAHITKIKEKR